MDLRFLTSDEFDRWHEVNVIDAYDRATRLSRIAAVLAVVAVGASLLAVTWLFVVFGTLAVVRIVRVLFLVRRAERNHGEWVAEADRRITHLRAQADQAASALRGRPTG